MAKRFLYTFCLMCGEHKKFTKTGDRYYCEGCGVTANG